MAKIFYDHLVLREEITVELDKYAVTTEEKEELVQLMDETLHHQILNTILTHLPKDQHQEFLEKFHQAPHDASLLEYIKDFEQEIIKEAQKIKRDLLSEIKSAARGHAGAKR
ncbi:hypothetical protein HY085_02130 [Candidatus Gottesmanbacteria bacterium]|nr:hypothetical protein [Candidatus Gottesmanbacteria bacterium]